MKRKIVTIEISNCKRCSHCQLIRQGAVPYYRCLHTAVAYGTTIDHPDTIPDWCPLPTKE